MRAGTDHNGMRAGAVVALLLAAALVIAPAASADHAAGEAAGPIGFAPPAEPAAPPTIFGAARAGEVLKGDDGQWEGAPMLTRYWLRCDGAGSNCHFIHHTEATFALGSADVGSTIRLRVLATTATGAREVESSPTDVVAAPPPPPRAAPAPARAPEGRPSIVVEPTLTGRLRQGRTIRLQPGFWSGTEPLTISSRWERCDAERCVPTGTSGLTHVLGRADVGMRMRAQVTTSNGAGRATAYTKQSAAVKPAYRLMSPFPRIEISGFIVRGGVRLRRLAVRAPPGSTVRMTCRGPRCPVGRDGGRLRSDLLVLRRMRGVYLRADVLLELRVTGSERIGKYTRFRIRRHMKPARVDRCLVPDQPRPTRCPAAS